MTTHTFLRAALVAALILPMNVAPAQAMLPGPDPVSAVGSVHDHGVRKDRVWLTEHVVRWDPCSPLVIEINPKASVPWFEREVRIVLADLGKRTGLQFTIVTTTATPSRAWASDWTEKSTPTIRIGATTGGDLNDGSVYGIAFNSWKDGSARYMRSAVVFDDASLLNLKPGDSVPNPGSSARLLIMHELGHAFGLEHTSGDEQAMLARLPGYEGPKPYTWGAGDLMGLYKISAVHGCRR